MSLQRAVFILLLLLPVCVLGQARYDANWTFGDGAGLHFNEDGTVSKFETDADNLETCATISDTTGNLLFYLSDCTLNFYSCIETDSSVSLINGDSIYSHRSFTNGAVFIPIDSLSYMLIHIAFNLDSMYSSTNRVIFNLYYSKISKVGNNLWEVTDKNHLISPIGIEEKLVVIKHANGNDWWILVHEDSGIDRQCSNRKLVFLYSEGTIQTYPPQPVGMDHCIGSSYYGEMAASPNGLIIAQTLLNERKVELYSFDRCSSKLTLMKTLEGFDFNEVYGLAFSPNDSLLYVSEILFDDDTNRLFQYNIANDSLKLLHTFVGIEQVGGQLELGPDGKIYFSPCGIYCSHVFDDNSRCIRVINSPNIPGINCDLNIYGVCYNDSIAANGGLPHFPNYNLGPSGIFAISAGADTVLCTNLTTSVQIGSEPQANILYQWQANPSLSSTNIAQPIASPTEDTWYYLTVTDTTATDCAVNTDSVFVRVVDCTGIEGVEESNFKLYPNPVSTTLTIEGVTENQSSYKLYSLLGELVLDISLKETTSIIDLSTFQSGLYFYTLSNDSGHAASGKLMVQ